MIKENNKLLIVFVIMAAMLSLSACQKDKEEKKSDQPLPPNPLSINELELSWIDSGVTYEDIEKEQNYLKKEISEDGQYLTYTMDNYLFTFAGDALGDSHKLLNIEIFADDNGKLSGPRDIQIGDDFDSVLNKLPQEKDWKSDQEGIFYGDSGVSTGPEFEKGSVTTFEDGSIDFITLVPKGNPPFIKIHFNNNYVSKMIIYYNQVM